MKRRMIFMIALAMSINLLSVGAVASENKYTPVSFSNEYATLSIDKARLIHEGQEGEYTTYGIPCDATLAVTITGDQQNLELYIGTVFSQYATEDALSEAGTLLKSDEFVLNENHSLQKVYSFVNDETSSEDDSWVGTSGFIRSNGTYTFDLPAANYIGWTFTPLCGEKIEPNNRFPESPTAKFHGFLNGNFVSKTSSMVSFIIEDADQESEMIFKDVPKDSYYYEPVQWAVQHKITTGKTESTFAPTETCTNAQILTFLWRAYGSEEPTIQNPFADIAPGEYYYRAAIWAFERGIISGAYFDAGKPCSRALAVTYFWNLAGKPDANNSIMFRDVSSKAPYYSAVSWAVQKGITKGVSAEKFAPELICTRAQITTFLYRALEK